MREAYQELLAAFDALEVAGILHPGVEPALPDDRPGLDAKEGQALLEGARTCIAARDQLGTCAFVRRYEALGADPRALFQLLLGFAVSEDGALHAEKFYCTAEREFATTRPARRWNHLQALGRVTASEHGWPSHPNVPRRAWEAVAVHNRVFPSSWLVPTLAWEMTERV